MKVERPSGSEGQCENSRARESDTLTDFLSNCLSLDGFA